jgi:hypothetical protein
MRAPVATFAIVLSIATLTVGCKGNRIEGTYADASGTIVLELKTGGRAQFTNRTSSEACTYHVTTDTIPVICPAGDHMFVMGQDGRLTAPSVIGALRRMP